MCHHELHTLQIREILGRYVYGTVLYHTLTASYCCTKDKRETVPNGLPSSGTAKDHDPAGTLRRRARHNLYVPGYQDKQKLPDNGLSMSTLVGVNNRQAGRLAEAGTVQRQKITTYTCSAVCHRSHVRYLSIHQSL